jgi:DNA-binding beta-propeller fold protein YncE
MNRRLAFLVGGALLALPLSASLAAPPHSPDLYVARFFGNDVQRFFGPQSATPGASHPAPTASGAEFSTGVVARRPWGIAFGPDGNLYVANQQGGDGAILRVHGPFAQDPGSVDAFVPSGNFMSLAFGLDQNLYAGGAGPVQRFDVATGASLGAFTSGRVPATVEGLAFGPDLNLYVASYNSCAPGPACSTTTGEILRFDGKTGAFIDVFVADGDGGLEHPGGIVFGTGGDLFVANEFVGGTTSGEVLRFHGPLSAAAGDPFPAPGQAGARFAAEPGASPYQLAFGPDRTLYVSSDAGVTAFNGRNGAFQKHFAAAQDARGIAFYNGAR